ncbi:hypothetical protein Moror_17491 [Moniliophthora roreri MCA 2997]|uniref:Threonylcarbamoyl-AMP synthase n=2 Tax=Moniliophthora roreri TaxID=221103 RepID=V2Z115_MONRO|nr:hypothetical protein Moror_17491 [Moniliophthora roreri MCA 2997]
MKFFSNLSESLKSFRFRPFGTLQPTLNSMSSAQILTCDHTSVSFDSSGQPEISSLETERSLQLAAQHLQNSQPIAFPTETVYGLGALALNDSAASRIFSTKGRPPDNPLIVHVSSLQMLNSLIPPSFTMPPSYSILMKRFWPGGLTLLFPRDAKIVPSIITAQQPTVAIRMPSHPIARALIALTNAPIAAPSANSSGKPSPTSAEHVFSDLGSKLTYILDGGPCGVGLESTVVDGLHEDGNIRVLRPGGVTVEDIQKALEEEMADGIPIPQVLVHRRDYRDAELEAAPTTPGMKYRHYSPAAPVTLLMTVTPSPKDVRPTDATSYFASLKQTLGSESPIKIGIMALVDSPLGTYSLPAIDGVEWHRFELGPKSKPSVTARRLFDGLFTLEREGVHLIITEEVEETEEGLAVMNRVRKAASESIWVSF